MPPRFAWIIYKLSCPERSLRSEVKASEASLLLTQCKLFFYKDRLAPPAPRLRGLRNKNNLKMLFLDDRRSSLYEPEQ